MQVEFLAENVDKFLPLLSRNLSSHSPVPVLSNFLIEATSRGIAISSTDLEMGTTIRVPAKITQEGAITIPGRQFAEVVSSLNVGPVLLKSVGDSAELTARNNRIVLRTIAKEEFPSLFAEKGKKMHSFLRSDFQNIFSKLTFVVSTDESRPALTGVYIHQQEDGIRFVATDGFRLSLRKLTNSHILGVGEGIIISARLVNEGLAIKEAQDSINMYYYDAGNQIILENGSVNLVGRSIEGEYPPYARVIPSPGSTRAVIDRDEFLRLIRLASVLARESANVVRLSVADNALSLYSKSSGIGEADTKMDIILEGNPTEISFNAKYLLDLLRATSDKTIIMELSKPDEPALFKTENDPDFLHVIMPIRVQE